MSEAAKILAALKEPFHPKQVRWRIGRKTKDGKKAQVLAYIDARDAQKRLDDVVGCNNWYPVQKHDNGLYLCTLHVRIDGEWIGKMDGAPSTQVEAQKGGLSDAFKRSAVLWGVGRYLYYVDSPWVPIDEWGNFTPPDLPKWAKPRETNND